MMTHHHFGFQCTNCFQSHADNDQNGSTAHCQRTEVRVCLVHRNREDCNNAEEERTNQSDLRKDTLNVIGCWLARANAWDTAVALPQIVCNFDRIVLHGYIEVVKCNNQNEINHCITPAVGMEEGQESIIELLPAANRIIVLGKDMKDIAKMIGITPLMQTFTGMWVD